MKPYEPRAIRLDMTGDRPFFRRDVLAPVLGSLAAQPLFAPERWGLGEGAGHPFDLEDVLRVARDAGSQFMLQLERDARLKHSTLIRLSRKPGYTTELPPATPAEDWRHLFELGDPLTEAYRPDIAWVHAFSTLDPPAATEAERTQLRMDASVVGSGVGYDDEGPGGLALRTYLGPRFVELIGRELLLSAPAHVAELSWGGVRVDLVAEPWRAAQGELHAAWLAATEHLKSARFFSEQEVDDDGEVYPTRGERFDAGER